LECYSTHHFIDRSTRHADGSRTNAKLMQDVSSFQIEPVEEISGDDLGSGPESSSSPSDDEEEPVARKKAHVAVEHVSKHEYVSAKQTFKPKVLPLLVL
jgi:hypothetical protein